MSSPRRAAHVALIALGIAACRSGSNAPTEGASASLGDAAVAVADVLTPPTPALTVDNRAPGQFVIRANAAVSVALAASIEHRSDDGQWTAYPDFAGGKGYRLIEQCEVPPSSAQPCRALAAGDVVVPVPWAGYSCSAQCEDGPGCDKNVFRSGVHRLVVQTCDDAKRRYEGLPFDIPATETLLARQQIAADILRVNVARVDPRRAKNAGDTRADASRPGFATMPGSEKAMEVDGRSELAKWLRNKENFKDGPTDQKKNCAQQPAVAFSLTSSAAPGRERAAEIVVEFGCSRATIFHERGSQRVTSISFFDPSRAVIIGIASRAMPSDTELARLQ